MKKIIILPILLLGVEANAMEKPKPAEANMSKPAAAQRRHIDGQQEREQLYGRYGRHAYMPQQNKVFKIPLKDIYIQHIKNGNKTIEGRINNGIFRAIKANSPH